MKALIFWEDVPATADMYLVDATPDDVDVLKAANAKYFGIDDDDECLDYVAHALATRWKGCKVDGPVMGPIDLVVQCGVMGSGDINDD